MALVLTVSNFNKYIILNSGFIVTTSSITYVLFRLIIIEKT